MIPLIRKVAHGLKNRGCRALSLVTPCDSYHRGRVVVIGLRLNGVTSPKFVQPGCTATTKRIQVGEMLLHEGIEAYKKEGPKFMQRLVAHSCFSGRYLPLRR
jgi:hypothetical protein